MQFGKFLLPRLVAFAAAAYSATAPANPAYEHVQRDEGPSYLLHLPAGYAENAERYPLLIFFHGIAQKGDGSANEIERVAADGPFRAMRDGAWDPTLPLIVAGPQAGGPQPWWPRDDAVAVLGHLLERYQVDRGRLYLSGISMGGRVVWWLVEQMPERFAAVIPTSAWSGDLADECVALSRLGVWAFHGARDPLIWSFRGRRPVQTLEDCGAPPRPVPHFTLLAGVGHGSWQRVYENAHDDAHIGADGRPYTDIYRWLLTHSLSSREVATRTDRTTQ